jgi:hypothetical protein
MNTDGKLKSTEWTTFESPFKNDNSEDKRNTTANSGLQKCEILQSDKFLFRKILS